MLTRVFASSATKATDDGVARKGGHVGADKQVTRCASVWACVPAAAPWCRLVVSDLPTCDVYSLYQQELTDTVTVAVPCCVRTAAAHRYDFAEWLSSRVMMQLSNEAGQSQVGATGGAGSTCSKRQYMLYRLYLYLQ
jgi:hypothetical protein